MMKNDVKKCHVKNDKVERVLLYHFFKMMKILLNMCLLGRKNSSRATKPSDALWRHKPSY